MYHLSTFCFSGNRDTHLFGPLDPYPLRCEVGPEFGASGLSSLLLHTDSSGKTQVFLSLWKWFWHGGGVLGSPSFLPLHLLGLLILINTSLNVLEVLILFPAMSKCVIYLNTSHMFSLEMPVCWISKFTAQGFHRYLKGFFQLPVLWYTIVICCCCCCIPEDGRLLRTF